MLGEEKFLVGVEKGKKKCVFYRDGLFSFFWREKMEKGEIYWFYR